MLIVVRHGRVTFLVVLRGVRSEATREDGSENVKLSETQLTETEGSRNLV